MLDDVGRWATVDPVFHIAEAAAWDGARAHGAYRWSTRGLTLGDVGFIHCSHRHQVERVANAFYRGAGPLVLLTIDPARVGAPLVEEPGGGAETFPHLYGPLAVAAVTEVRPLAPAVCSLHDEVFVPPESWVSPKVVVRASPIEGLGLFAGDAIATGEVIAVMGGEVMTDEEFGRHTATVGRWSASAVAEGFNVVQAPDDPLARGNHSCAPNAWMADEITIVAGAAVAPGQEITTDYALMTVDESWSMTCACGAAECRAVISGADWRRADLQARYAGHFSPVVQARISGEALLAEQRRYYELRAPDYGLELRAPDRKARGDLETGLAAVLIDAMQPHGDILELACGPGAFTRELARHADTLTALDASAAMLARNRSEVADPTITYVERDLFTWQPGRRFDFVFFGFWLSHVPPSAFDTFWGQVDRCLRPGGRFGFVDEDERGLGVMDEPHTVGGVPAARRTLADGRAFEIVKVFWSPDRLASALDRLGFEVDLSVFGDAFMTGVGRRRDRVRRQPAANRS